MAALTAISSFTELITWLLPKLPASLLLHPLCWLLPFLCPLSPGLGLLLLSIPGLNAIPCHLDANDPSLCLQPVCNLNSRPMYPAAHSISTSVLVCPQSDLPPDGPCHSLLHVDGIAILLVAWGRDLPPFVLDRLPLIMLYPVQKVLTVLVTIYPEYEHLQHSLQTFLLHCCRGPSLGTPSTSHIEVIHSLQV